MAPILENWEPFKESRNAYDWLGRGVYFWQENPARAWQWANEQMMRSLKKGTRKAPYEPAVLGAVVDLGLCLDLLSTKGIDLVRDGYESLRHRFETAGILGEMPKNLDLRGRQQDDLALRHLDCAIINKIAASADPPFDTVRGVFIEGDRLYDGSGFFEKTHIQVCVRNQKAIKAVFRVNPSEYL